METIQDIKEMIKYGDNAGYFYANNCKLCYSSISGWYCKDLVRGHIKTYNITETQVNEIIAKSLKD